MEIDGLHGTQHVPTEIGDVYFDRCHYYIIPYHTIYMLIFYGFERKSQHGGMNLKSTYIRDIVEYQTTVEVLKINYSPESPPSSLLS